MIKDNLRYVLLAFSIIAAAIIISESISQSALYLAHTITAIKPTGEIKLSEESLKYFSDELKKAPESAARPPRPEPGSKLVPGIEAGRYILGNPEAAVKIVEFSDFECPFSKKFTQTSLKEIKDTFIKDQKVNYSYRHLALDFHPNAKEAAMATECAGEQGKFWEMKNMLFSKDKLNSELIANSAKELKLKTKKFDKCMKNTATKKLIEADLKTAQDKGINGTPTILINGRLISGAHPFKTFEKIIKEELKKSEK